MRLNPQPDFCLSTPWSNSIILVPDWPVSYFLTLWKNSIIIVIDWPGVQKRVDMFVLLLPLLFLVLFSFGTPSLCYRIFNSRDAVGRSVIEACRAQLPREKAQCYQMLQCIIDNVPSDFTARWSAGSSILAFIPTIVGLMSNSINEVTFMADESFFLALALSVTSTTAFFKRFGDGPIHLSGTFFEEQRGKDVRIQAALAILKDEIPQTQELLPWWQSRRMPICILSLAAVVLGAVIWYEVYEVTKYGIITFACPIKVNIGIWVGLSQLLCLANLLGRSILFDIRTIHLRARGAVSPAHLAGSFPHAKGSIVVLRCPRDTFLRWVFQTFTAVASFVLYAYGTVLLASTTLVPASDAIRAMVVMTSSAGFGRLVGYWLTRPKRRSRRIVVVDVPPDCLSDFASSIAEQL